MNWGTWGDFVAMGGYGLYVWGSVLVVLAALASELASLAWRRRAIVSRLKEQA